MFQIVLKTFLWLKKSKTLCRGDVISDLKGEEIGETYYEKELQKTDQKVIMRKGDKIYVKWEGCDSSFNNWINKKNIV